MSDCVFCKIVGGEIPAYKVYEDEVSIAFLDAFPFVEGQTLVIPKRHMAPWLFDLDDNTYSKIMLSSKKVARAVDKAMNPKKTGLMVEGLELDHVHVKIFPLTEKGFGDYPRQIKIPKEKMEEIAEKIRQSFD